MTELKGTCHCGAVTWTFAGMPDSAAACNCTLCRRYGVLWIYGFEGEGVAVTGPTIAYKRGDLSPYLDVRFCGTCGNVVCWRALELAEGRRRIGVNLRLTEPGPVARVPVRRVDGLADFAEGEPGPERCVADLWW